MVVSPNFPKFIMNFDLLGQEASFVGVLISDSSFI